MGAVYSLSNDAASTGLLVLVSLNLFSLVSFAGEASAVYLDHSERNKQISNAYSIRLQLVRVLVSVISVAAGLKITIQSKLADDLIAAWFVGQGFALQDILRNMIHGVMARYSPRVTRLLYSTVTFEDEEYKVIDVNIASITLCYRGDKNSGPTYLRVLPWTSISTMKLHD